MTTDTAYLTLAQWLSPAFPLGSFAYSHGVEAAIAAGWITDAVSLQTWLSDILTSGTGRSDAILLCCAYDAPDHKALSEIDATGRAFAASHERLRESLQQGAAFARTASAIVPVTIPETLLPVGLGWAAGQTGLPRQLTAAMYLQAFVSNIVMACTRLMPLGQTDAQRIIAALTPLCDATAQAACHDGLDDLYSNTFLSDIAAMRHETQQPRLFQS